VDANDILIAHVSYEDTSTTPSTPAGWTLLAGPYNIGTTPNGRHWVFGKIAAGTEDGSTVNFGTQGGTVGRWGRIYSFSGWVAGAIADIAISFASIAHATDPQMPTVKSSVPNSLAVALVTQNDNNSIGSATGESGGNWTEATAEFTNTTVGTQGCMCQLQTAALSTALLTISGGTAATNDDPCGVIAFELRPTNVMARSDTGAGVDSKTLVTPTHGYVSWVRMDTPAAPYQGTDSGTGADSRTNTASLPRTDSGSGADASSLNTGATSKSGTDSGSGADASSEAVALPRSDTGAGTEVSSERFIITRTDSVSGADTVKSFARPITDTGTGTDASVKAQAFLVNDTGSETEASQQRAIYGRTDACAGSDASTASVSAVRTDTGVGSDASTLRVSITSPELGFGRDRKCAAGGIWLFGDCSPAAQLTAAISASDTGTGLDLSSKTTETSKAGSDIGSGADLSSLRVVESVSSIGTGSDTSIVRLTKFGTDTGTGVDSVPVYRRILVETATGFDTSFALGEGIKHSYEVGVGLDTSTKVMTYPPARPTAGIELNRGGEGSTIGGVKPRSVASKDTNGTTIVASRPEAEVESWR
jgi:hypothetical protein